MATYTFETMTQADANAFDGGDTLNFASTAPANVVVAIDPLGFTSVTVGTLTRNFPDGTLQDSGTVIKFTAGEDSFLEVGGNNADTILTSGADTYVYGFNGDDSIGAGAGDDFLFGGAGADTISASNGNDYVYGGADGDIIDGGSGADHLYGFALTGTLTLDGDDNINGGEGNDYVQGNAGEDDLSGGNGNDRLNGGADNDEINGDDGSDTVNGNKGDDFISGDDGNDSLRGGQGDDSISGGADNDVILGDLGNDTIDGGDGVDLLTGGDGDDVFVFGAGDAGLPDDDEDSDVFGLVDTITDFVSADDLIDIGNLGQSSADVIKAQSGITLSGLDAATTYAQERLDAHAGGTDVAVLEVGSDTYLFYNSGGTTAAIDSIIKLVGVDADDVTTDSFVEFSV